MAISPGHRLRALRHCQEQAANLRLAARPTRRRTEGPAPRRKLDAINMPVTMSAAICGACRTRYLPLRGACICALTVAQQVGAEPRPGDHSP